jgi:hypothetical protein
MPRPTCQQSDPFHFRETASLTCIVSSTPPADALYLQAICNHAENDPLDRRVPRHAYRCILMLSLAFTTVARTRTSDGQPPDLLRNRVRREAAAVRRVALPEAAHASARCPRPGAAATVSA